MTPTQHLRHLIALPLREALEDVAMTQEALADQLGISRSTIARRFALKTSWPVEDLIAACDVLALNVGDLVNAARKPAAKTRKRAA